MAFLKYSFDKENYTVTEIDVEVLGAGKSTILLNADDSAQLSNPGSKISLVFIAIAKLDLKADILKAQKGSLIKTINSTQLKELLDKAPNKSHSGLQNFSED